MKENPFSLWNSQKARKQCLRLYTIPGIDTQIHNAVKKNNKSNGRRVNEECHIFLFFFLTDVSPCFFLFFFISFTSLFFFSFVLAALFIVQLATIIEAYDRRETTARHADGPLIFSLRLSFDVGLIVYWKKEKKKGVSYRCSITAVSPLLRDIKTKIISALSTNFKNKLKCFAYSGWDLATSLCPFYTGGED